MPDFDANDDIMLPGSGSEGSPERPQHLPPLVRRARDLAFYHPAAKLDRSGRRLASGLLRRRRSTRRACHAGAPSWAVGTASPRRRRLRARCLRARPGFPS
jgi:hypothetical protein